MKAATVAPLGRTFEIKGWGCAKDAEHNLLQASGNRGTGREAFGVNGRDLGAGSALAGGSVQSFKLGGVAAGADVFSWWVCVGF